MRLQSQLEELWKGNWALWGVLQNGGFHTELDEAVRSHTDLSGCWEVLKRYAPETIGLAFRRDPNYRTEEVDTVRLLANARALVATARAAIAAKRCAIPDLIQHWREAAAALQLSWPPKGHLESNWAPDGFPSPEQLIESLHGELKAPQRVLQWTRYHLRIPSVQRAAMRVPVAGVWNSRGFVADLEFERFNGTEPELLERAETALRPFGIKMVETLFKTWERSGLCVGWSLALSPRSRNRDVPDWALLDGESLGGASAVALQLLARGWPYDPECVVMLNGTVLTPVGEEERKLEASADAGLKRAILAPRSKPLPSSRLSLTCCSTVEQAIEICSGQLHNLQRVLEAETRLILEDADRRVRGREFLVWTDLEELLVPIKLARGLRPRLTQAEYEELERQRSRGEYQGIDRLASRRRDEEEDGRPDFRRERMQAALRRQTVSWEDVRGSLRRGVILGDPGFGKTTLLWQEVGKRNQEWLHRIADHEAGLDQVEVAVFLRALELAEWVSRGMGLLEALASHRQRPWRIDDGSVKLVLGKLTAGAGLIAIDALDEVPQSLRPGLDATLKAFGEAYPNARVLLSSRLVGYTLPPLTVNEDDQFEALAFEQDQMEKAVKAWFHPDRTAAAEAWSHLQKQSSIAGDLRCPLLLRLACGLVAEPKEKGSSMPTWETRTELYEAFLNHGITQWSERTNPRRQARGLFLDFAAEVALDLWKTDARRTLWSQEQVARTIDAAQRGHAALLAEPDLLSDLLVAGVLAVAGPDEPSSPLMFTHRSFAEYLVARGLASKLTDSQTTEWGQLDEKSWDPDWKRVFLFLTCCLASRPGGLSKLIEMLIDERTDDVVHYRLLLAAECLAELPAKMFPALGTTPARIVQRAFSWWEDMRTSDANAVLPVLALVDTKAESGLLVRLVGQLGGPSGPGQARAEEALAQMGAAAARSDILPRLLELLHGEGWAVLGPARVLGHMGAAAAQAPIVARLRELLDEDFYAMFQAGKALGRMGVVTAREEILSSLLNWLGEPDKDEQISAHEALTPPEAAVAREKVLARLLENLHDPWWAQRSASASALGEMGSPAAHEEILARLQELLSDPESSVRKAAAEALLQLGAAARPGISARCLELLDDPDCYVMLAAAEVLGQAGTAACDEAIARLLELLRDPNQRGRGTAVSVLGRIGAMDRKEILALAQELLSDPQSFVRSAAAEALGRMGEAAASPEVLTELVELLGDSDKYVRTTTASALGQMGEKVTSEEILVRLVGLLRDESEDVQRRGADVLARIAKSGIHIFMEKHGEKMTIKRLIRSSPV